MSIVDLNHCNLVVPRAQLTAVVAFYVDALGFEYREFERDGRRLYWLYANERPLLHLTVTDDGVAAAPRADAPATTPIDHIAFSATDLAAVCGRLEQLGLEHHVKPYPQMGFTQVVVHDPIGLKVELNFAAVSSTRPPG